MRGSSGIRLGESLGTLCLPAISDVEGETQGKEIETS